MAKPFSPPQAEAGSALIYILIAIALLAALTITFMEPSSQQTSSQNTFKTASGLESQANLIMSAIQECVVSYPKGDNAIIVTGGGATDLNARKNYPINPDSTYYTSATPGRSGNQLVKNLRCPGNNPGGLLVKNHEKIFVGSAGKYLPPPPDLFDDWQYYNGTDGVFFWTKTNKTDAYLAASLKKLDDKYAECETDIIDTSVATAGAKNLDSAGVYQCPAGYLCWRVRMIAKPSAVYNGDADSDETSCP